jgi:RHS repeat-associated protein
LREQSVTYTSFERPNVITENGITGTFTYNAAGDRVKMAVLNGPTNLLTRYYLGGQYEIDNGTTATYAEKLYVGGDSYSASAVYVKSGSAWSMMYILRDYLGSITHITNASGGLVQELSYDAWGRLRNPATQTSYTPGNEPNLNLGRGYTGHEHLSWFGLVNMNARLYDPAVGRFLAPDPYVQNPFISQNFNRYSYALNNPLRYTDPDGEFWHLVIGAVIGGVVNWATHGFQFNAKGLGYFGVGAAVGVLSAAGGVWISGATKALGVIAGASVGAGSGAVTGAASSVVLNGLNNTIGGQNFWNNAGQSAISGAISGAIAGGIGGGIKGYQNAKNQGANPWTGKKIIDTRTYNTSLKTISLQPDHSKNCYAYELEYADRGRGNTSAYDILKANDFEDGAILTSAARKAELGKSIMDAKSLTGREWEQLGIQMRAGKVEIGLTISINGSISTGHAVSAIGITIQDQLRLIGGNFKSVLQNVMVVDPRGYIYSLNPNRILGITFIRY